MKVFLYDRHTKGVLECSSKKTTAEVIAISSLSEHKNMSQAVAHFLDQVDALLIEITDPTDLEHFILAQAVLADKPTLCLYQKNRPPRKLLDYIRSRKTPRSIKTFSYSPSTVDEAIESFIRRHNPDSLDDVHMPSIKYTLRLTPFIDQYLDWVSRQQSKTKANMIRSILIDAAERDEDYRG